MIRVILLLAAGTAAYVLAFPPADLAPLGILALLAFGMAFQIVPMGAVSWLLVYASGILIYFAGCHWIAEVNGLSLFLMALIEGLSLPLCCLLYRMAVLSRFRPLPPWFALPLAWTAVEYVRSIFPLDGFPWLLLGYTQWRLPPLIQIADITGVYGPGFLEAMTAGLIVSWLAFLKVGKRPISKKPILGTLVYGALLVVTFCYGLIRPGTLEIREGPVLAAVQGNIPQELKGNDILAETMFQRYLETTRQALTGEDGLIPDLVIWPETVFPYYLGEGRPGDVWLANGYGYEDALALEKRFLVKAVVEELLAPHDAWFLTGVIGLHTGSDGRVEKRNGAFLYDPEGRRRGVYYKTILVPVGEYLPWIDWLPFGDTLETYVYQVAGLVPSLDPGFGVQVMTLSAGREEFRIGVQICFENIYGSYCRQFVRQGADIMINLSNEGWFKTSSEFDQMLAMSVFRAVETRRALFRCTNTGISCLIGPKGGIPGDENRILAAGRDRAVQGVLVKTVPICGADTLYTQLGDLFSRGVLFTQILYLFLLILRKFWVTKYPLPE